MNHKLHAENCFERVNVHVTVQRETCEVLGEPRSPDPTGYKARATGDQR